MPGVVAGGVPIGGRGARSRRDEAGAFFQRLQTRDCWYDCPSTRQPRVGGRVDRPVSTKATTPDMWVTLLQYALTSLYIAVLCAVAFYGLHRYILVYLYIKHRKD